MNVKEMIVEAGRKMYNTGLVAGTSGNISMRNPDKEDSFFITPSSMAYDQIQEHDIVEINSKGEPYIKGQRPSSEWQMHVSVYKRFEKYNDSFFEIIGYLSDWGDCCSGTYDTFDYYRQKTSDEFKSSVAKELGKRFYENPNVRTEMIIDEIDKEFILSNNKKLG